VGVGVQREVAARRRRGRVWMYIVVASLKIEVQKLMKNKRDRVDLCTSEGLAATKIVAYSSAYFLFVCDRHNGHSATFQVWRRCLGADQFDGLA